MKIRCLACNGTGRISATSEADIEDWLSNNDIDQAISFWVKEMVADSPHKPTEQMHSQLRQAILSTLLRYNAANKPNVGVCQNCFGVGFITKTIRYTHNMTTAAR